MSDFEGFESQAEFERQFAEWCAVKDRYDDMLPRVVDLCVGPAQREDEGLMAAAGLKAAVHTTYIASQPVSLSSRMPILKISHTVREDGTKLWVQTGGGGLSEPTYFKLFGVIEGKSVQNLGVISKNRLLQAPNNWIVSGLASGHDPFIDVAFTEVSNLTDSLELSASFNILHKVNLLHQGDSRRGARYGLKREKLEEVDPEVAEATIILTQAITRWITRPEGAVREWLTDDS